MRMESFGRMPIILLYTSISLAGLVGLSYGVYYISRQSAEWRLRRLALDAENKRRRQIYEAEAEERLRVADIERQRLDRIRQAERERQRVANVEQKRVADIERQRRDRIRHDEEERQRVANIEQKRVADIERQRLDRIRETNERERQRLEQVRLDEEQELLRVEEEQLELQDHLSFEIDYHIRTRRAFDSRNPLAYNCSISSIQEDEDIEETLNKLNAYGPFSLQQFISHDDQFRTTIARSGKIKTVGVTHLTPFQGGERHRVYGYFSCGKCQRTWESAASWTNKWQKCKGCNSMCYPYDQHVLDIDENRDESDTTKRPHDMERCEKCLELGRLCMPARYYASNSNSHYV